MGFSRCYTVGMKKLKLPRVLPRALDAKRLLHTNVARATDANLDVLSDRARRIMVVFGVITILSVVVLIMMGLLGVNTTKMFFQQPEKSSASAVFHGSQAQYSSDEPVRGFDAAKRYDEGLPVTVQGKVASSAVKVQPEQTASAVEVRGEYSSDRYERSVRISQRLAQKYQRSFVFYPVVQVSQQDGLDSGRDVLFDKASGMFFQASLTSDGVEDNLYLVSQKSLAWQMLADVSKNYDAEGSVGIGSYDSVLGAYDYSLGIASSAKDRFGVVSESLNPNYVNELLRSEGLDVSMKVASLDRIDDFYRREVVFFVNTIKDSSRNFPNSFYIVLHDNAGKSLFFQVSPDGSVMQKKAYIHD